MTSEVEPLLKIIEEKLDWGGSETWKTEDFENLHQLILEHTGVSLSISTLRRVWGKVEYGHLPSSTTINTLTKFAGYDNWRSFLKQQSEKETAATVEKEAIEVTAQERPGPAIPWVKIASAAMAVLAISLVSIFAFKKAPKQIVAKDYRFSSKPVTREIPNSVIFTYDASASPTDSIFIQQSWDSRRRSIVEKNAHTQTSIYYEPGFFTAKLIIDSQVVKEHPLLIPTNGWLGLIDHQPVPVYLKTSEFMNGNMMLLPVETIQKNNIPMEPQVPVIKYFNVGNFDPVPVSRFSFSTEIKNEYKDGAAACQLSYILLITDDNPIIIPLSVKGCTSELNLVSLDEMVSGKKADLSGFGVDFSTWVKVSCRSTNAKLQYFVNEKPAYECPLPQKPVHVVGMAYAFMGTGAVRKITLESNGAKVFQAF